MADGEIKHLFALALIRAEPELFLGAHDDERARLVHRGERVGQPERREGACGCDDRNQNPVREDDAPNAIEFHVSYPLKGEASIVVAPRFVR